MLSVNNKLFILLILISQFLIFENPISAAQEIIDTGNNQCERKDVDDDACNTNKRPSSQQTDLNKSCQECRLTGRSVDDLVRRPRQVNPYGDIDERIDLDKIKKLVCRDYSDDGEREKCRDFYFSNLPTIINWKETRPKVSFQDYVCIQKLKYCCPESSFGPKCKKCPDCNPNEKCSGAGSRTGNGTCMCKDGHTGPDCVSCLPGYYFQGTKKEINHRTNGSKSIQSAVNETICRKCHRSCLYCRDAGPDGCEVCKAGYTFIPNYGCSDVDECLQTNNICGSNTFCVNTEGSYFCYDCDRGCDGCHADGPDNCLKCAKGYNMENNICKAPRATILKPEAHYARYIIYLGLGIVSLILYNNNIYLSASIGLVGAIYAGGSEYFLSLHLDAP